MKPNKTFAFRATWKILTAGLLLAAVFAGCGGDIGLSSDNGGTSGSGTIIGGVGTGGTGVIKASSAETAVDSGLIGAIVFQDKNGNRKPDPDEPSAITDQNGSYRLTLDSAEPSAYPLLIMALAGKTIDKATGKFVTVDSVSELGPALAGQ